MADLTVPFALDENGKLISASSETSDFKNLTCIECSKPLIHRKSYYRQCRQQKVFVRSHFAHHGGTGHGTGEGYYHKSAKRILCENDVIIYNSCLVCRKELSPYHRVQAEKCTEEFGWEFNNHTFRIDVAEIDKGQPKAFIEVKDTHACTPDKIKCFEDSKIPWFEIDAKELCEIFESPSFFLKIKPIKSSLPHICELCFKEQQREREERQRKQEDRQRKKKEWDQYWSMVVKESREQGLKRLKERRQSEGKCMTFKDVSWWYPEIQKQQETNKCVYADEWNRFLLKEFEEQKQRDGKDALLSFDFAMETIHKFKKQKEQGRVDCWCIHEQDFTVEQMNDYQKMVDQYQTRNRLEQE